MSSLPAPETLTPVCADLVPVPGHAPLAAALAGALNRPALQPVARDEAWYRLGRVIDGRGATVAEDLETWILAETGGDLEAFYAQHAETEAYVTRREGRTVYLTVPTGPAPLDFLQVAVDVVEERVHRALLPEEPLPDMLVDFVDPATGGGRGGTLGPARYEVQGVTDVAALAPRLTTDHRGDPRFRRFVEEWEATSAGRARFCDHWALQLQPYQDPRGEHLLEARPVAAERLPLPLVREAPDEKALLRLLSDYDRAVGYTMAWYFAQVARHYAPYGAVLQAHEAFLHHHPGGPGLPAGDLAILEGWLTDPYCFL